MAHKSGLGLELNLDLVPKRETGIGQDYFPEAKSGPLTGLVLANPADCADGKRCPAPPAR